MKTYRLFIQLLGIVLVLLAIGSCKKDKDSDICITCSAPSYTTVTLCKSNPALYSAYDNWDDFVDDMKASYEILGGSCN
jgi:hypothetical protein